MWKKRKQMFAYCSQLSERAKKQKYQMYYTQTDSHLFAHFVLSGVRQAVTWPLLIFFLFSYPCYFFSYSDLLSLYAP